jgi:hypothetical protein
LGGQGQARFLSSPFPFANLSVESRRPYGRDMDQWSLFRTEGAVALMRHIDGDQAHCKDRNVELFLCFYFHPWEFHPMPSESYYGECLVTPNPFIVKNCGAFALEQLDNLLGTLRDRGAGFFQAREIAEV